MKELVDILRSLMVERNCYDPQKVQLRVEKGWSASEQDALFNIGIRKKCLAYEEVEELIASEVFSRHFDSVHDYTNFFKQIPKLRKQQYLDLSHHYYFWCCQPKLAKLDQSFKLIVATSLIESLMSDVNYKEFLDWFQSECDATTKQQTISENNELNKVINKLWQDYKEKYGATKKIVSFFTDHLGEQEVKTLQEGVRRLDSGKKLTVDDIAKLLYEMRSRFVHKAEIVQLAETDGRLLHKVGKHHLSFKISIDDFLTILEKGFINFFSNAPKS